eukprot:2755784-Pleurochrysis_carterae.AAC.1
MFRSSSFVSARRRHSWRALRTVVRAVTRRPACDESWSAAPLIISSSSPAPLSQACWQSISAWLRPAPRATFAHAQLHSPLPCASRPLSPTS